MIDFEFEFQYAEEKQPTLQKVGGSIPAGRCVVLCGGSGCGKSTLLHLIARLLSLDSGEILINGYPLVISKEKVGYMLQNDQLLPWKTIYENAVLGLKIQKIRDPAAYERVEHLLTSYGLEDFRDSYPDQLSGGMRQRAALIRTLALSPDILLLDEPFSALDYQTRLNVSNDIGTIIKKEHKTALLVTHDLSEAVSMADRVIVLTRRPGTVKSIIPIHLSCPEKTPKNARNAVEFKDYFNQLWRDINDT